MVARVSPLYAYLGAHPVEPRHPVPGAKGRRLTWNPVYAHGTERSAKNAAGYRLGMTMTEWACRSLLGLGQTEHLELGGPVAALSNTFKVPKKKLPDLWGRHEVEELYWLIEAKGGDVGFPALVQGPSHRRALSHARSGQRTERNPIHNFGSAACSGWSTGSDVEEASIGSGRDQVEDMVEGVPP